mmetsp:Transcript_6000/g.14319  ORF Transcript_6000/g.14319 Transcript_6000/m.14319 type:complete len:585 (-) Transcript_6000:316-2070(-)
MGRITVFDDDGQGASRNFPTKMVESLLESIAVKNNGITQFKAWTYLAYHRRAEKRDPGSTPRALQRKWFSAPAGMYLSEPMLGRESGSMESQIWEWLSGSVAVPRQLDFEWGDEQRMAIVWSLPAKEVMLAGEFTSPPWSVRLRLLRCPKSEKFWVPVKVAFPTLLPGKYDYKFIVDGQWRIDPAGYTHRDASGHINNVLHHEVAFDDKGHTRASQVPHKKAWSAGDHEEEEHGAQLKSANSFGPSTIEDGVWPRSVLDHLSAPGSGARSAGPTSRPRSTRNLRLVCGSFTIPHPDKVHNGADSCFFSDTSGAFGVADGVGEWEWRFKINPRAFADEMMFACKDVADRDALGEMPADELARETLTKGYNACKSLGSSTALVARLDREGKTLGVANIGDSGLMHIRREEHDSFPREAVVHRTKEQLHSFNCPYQLCKLPEKSEYPRLVAEGREALVRVLQRNTALQQDTPENAELYSFDLQEGDVLIAGSDGLFDNLFAQDVRKLCSMAISPYDAEQSNNACAPTLPEDLAMAVAKAAFTRSLDTSARTPFSVNARRVGAMHFGGKMDDICVVAAWVVAGDQGQD